MWCENCGKQGHKFFECPEKIISMKSKNKIVCQHCGSTNHPSNDCPEKAKSRHIQNALTNGVDPKSNQLAIEANRMLSVEDELKEFMNEIQRDKDEKEKIKMITHQAIVSNARKSYDEQRDLGELIQEHRENEEAMLEINQEK